jgi:choline dehydrogenase-like flavoprotein
MTAAALDHPFPDEDLPEGAVIAGDELDRDVRDTFDFIVIGSGASGAVAAHTLTRAGFSVAMVEEGPWVKTRAFGEDVYGAFCTMFRDAGAQIMEGRAIIPMLQGRCVGGSTVMNSAIAWRTPEDVLEEWRSRFGLGDAITARALEPHFDALERDLNVHAVEDEALGENNRLLLEEGERAGLDAHRVQRFESGCKGSGRCMTGCPNAAKQGMNVSYVPWALANGARLFTSCRVERVTIAKGRATGISARTVPGLSGGARGSFRVELSARRGVVVAASAVQTPNLLRRSGVRAPDLGAHFQAHPAVGMAGVFDAPVAMHFGATQGAEISKLRTTDGIKIETVAMQPELAAVRMPGVGHDLMRRFAEYSHLAVWGMQVRTRAEGAVSSGWGGRDKVRFTLTAEDMERVRKGCALIARLLFEAGAREVWPGIYGLPTELRSMDDVRLVAEGPIDPRSYGLISTHLFGTARMGPDPRQNVVGLDFGVHAVRGLWVVDSSVFPTNLGVNPQHTIMAVARLAATRVADAVLKAA